MDILRIDMTSDILRIVMTDYGVIGIMGPMISRDMTLYEYILRHEIYICIVMNT